MELSIIIITKNEESNIQNCLDSVIREVSYNCAYWEIIVVDSSSDDTTVDLASRYPVDILIVKGNFLSASLGRRLGLEQAKYPYVLFLDGDMELKSGFITEAEKLFKADTQVAGVIGIREDIIYKEDAVVGRNPNVYNTVIKGECKHFGGALLASKQALLRVGNYDARMMSNEEPEIHSRLMKFGYKIVEIPIPMIVHHDGRGRKEKKLLSRIINKRSLGLGTGLKVSMTYGSTMFYLKRLAEFMIPVFVDILAFLLIGISALSISYWPLLMALILEIISVIYCFSIHKLKRYIQAKFLFPYFVFALLKPLPVVEYEVERKKG